MKKLPIQPFASRACTSFSVPGSKSVTNRALLLAAMSDYPLCVMRPLHSRDSRIMVECLRNLGYAVKENPESIVISGECQKNADLFVGNAGTAARFLTAFVCSKEGGVYNFDSDAAMYRRPMGGLIKALEKQGAEFSFKHEKYCFPFTVKTNGLKGGEIVLDASESSQILSAILMACPMAKSDCSVRLSGGTVSKPFVEMTMSMLAKFGFVAECAEDGSYRVAHGVTVSPARYYVESDATAASYPVALAAAVGGAVLIENFPFSGLQGDADFVRVMEEAGFVKTSKVGSDLLVVGCQKRDRDFAKPFDFEDISDTFLTLAALAPAVGASLKIEGIGHTRRQETDRVEAMRAETSKISKKSDALEYALEIDSWKLSELKDKINAPVEIKTYDDHRVAMAFGVIGCADLAGTGKPWLTVLDPECVSKTFPKFFEVLEEARMNSQKFKIVAIDGGAAVGKSSVSRECSATLNYMHVDTGSHYRTLAFIMLENGIDGEDSAKAEKFLKTLKLSTYLEGNTARMGIDGKKIADSDIRNDRVNSNVAQFAAMPFVREFLKGYQRSMADEARKRNFGGLVMEGRDIGTVIFTDANLKVFLDADEETRMKRRSKEGIADSIAKRDAMDKNRKTAPLTCAEDAVLIDTSKMTKEEVVAKTLSLIIKS